MLSRLYYLFCVMWRFVFLSLTFLMRKLIINCKKSLSQLVCCMGNIVLTPFICCTVFIKKASPMCEEADVFSDNFIIRRLFCNVYIQKDSHQYGIHLRLQSNGSRETFVALGAWIHICTCVGVGQTWKMFGSGDPGSLFFYPPLPPPPPLWAAILC